MKLFVALITYFVLTSSYVYALSATPPSRNGHRLDSTVGSTDSDRSSNPKSNGRRIRESRRDDSTNGRRTREPRRNESRRKRPESPRRSQRAISNPEPFDALTLVSKQESNEDAQPINLSTATLRIISSHGKDATSDSLAQQLNTKMVDQDKVLTFFSLDDLFPNLDFSKVFHTNSTFRESIRSAIRRDIFNSTPGNNKISEKVAAIMLADESSLQGTWNIANVKMEALTQVMVDGLGESAPTGIEFMKTVGGLCGKNPSMHWIDIIGVKKRTISHAWHQDTGRLHPGVGGSGNTEDGNCDSFTVMLGFPCEDLFTGTGIFTHVVKLDREHYAPIDHNFNEPILFEGRIEENFIVRPKFGLGSELVRFRDVDVLHSAPDVTYRTSVMRFM